MHKTAVPGTIYSEHQILTTTSTHVSQIPQVLNTTAGSCCAGNRNTDGNLCWWVFNAGRKLLFHKREFKRHSDSKGSKFGVFVEVQAGCLHYQKKKKKLPGALSSQLLWELKSQRRFPSSSSSANCNRLTVLTCYFTYIGKQVKIEAEVSWSRQNYTNTGRMLQDVAMLERYIRGSTLKSCMKEKVSVD